MRGSAMGRWLKRTGGLIDIKIIQQFNMRTGEDNGGAKPQCPGNIGRSLKVALKEINGN